MLANVHTFVLTLCYTATFPVDGRHLFFFSVRMPGKWLPAKAICPHRRSRCPLTRLNSSNRFGRDTELHAANFVVLTASQAVTLMHRNGLRRNTRFPFIGPFFPPFAQDEYFPFKKKNKKKEKGAVCVCFHEKAIVAPPHGHDGRPLVSFVLGFSSVFIGPTIQGQCIDVRLLFWDVDRFTGVSILNPHKAKR